MDTNNEMIKIYEHFNENEIFKNMMKDYYYYNIFCYDKIRGIIKNIVEENLTKKSFEELCDKLLTQITTLIQIILSKNNGTVSIVKENSLLEYSDKKIERNLKIIFNYKKKENMYCYSILFSKIENDINIFLKEFYNNMFVLKYFQCYDCEIFHFTSCFELKIHETLQNKYYNS